MDYAAWVGGRTPASAADPLVGLYFAEKNRRFRRTLRVWLSIGDDFRTIMRRTSPSSSHGVCGTVCLVTGLSRRQLLLLDGHLAPWIACWRKPVPGRFIYGTPAVADMVVEAIHYNAANLEHYVLHAFVVMPNHVHLLATPTVTLPKLTKSLKGHHRQTGPTPYWQ